MRWVPDTHFHSHPRHLVLSLQVFPRSPQGLTPEAGGGLREAPSRPVGKPSHLPPTGASHRRLPLRPPSSV